jgi:hypothetical protein
MEPKEKFVLPRNGKSAPQLLSPNSGAGINLNTYTLKHLNTLAFYFTRWIHPLQVAWSSTETS